MKNLAQGRAAAKIEGTTVLWAILDPQPAVVLREEGGVHGGDDPHSVRMDCRCWPARCRISPIYATASRLAACPAWLAAPISSTFEYTSDSLPHDDVPKGRLEKFEWRDSKVFPGTVRDVTVYLPARPPAGEETCLMVWQDGTRHADPAGSMRVPVVFDNLIHQKAMPRTVGIFIDPGRKPQQKPGDKAANRGFEYDSLGDAYVRFLLEEIIPEVEKRHAVKLRAISYCPGHRRWLLRWHLCLHRSMGTA
jgi:hypothetical protein